VKQNLKGTAIMTRNPLLFPCVVALFLSLTSGTVDATNGIDISLFQCEDGVSSDQWSCLASNLGANAFAIIQVWDGGYQLDSSTANCVAGALAAGFAHVDVYVFMCNQCDNNGDPSVVISSINNYLKGNNVNFGMLWFDVEQCDGCWGDVDSNAQYLLEAVQAAQSSGLNVGMYSSEGEWPQTVGSSTAFDSLPLWYAHYDGDPSFDDSWAYEFGGWTSPAIKQYAGTSTLCSTSVDSNWYPDSGNFRNNATMRSFATVGDLRQRIARKQQNKPPMQS